MAGQPNKALRRGGQGLNDRLEQAYPYRELDEQRAEAAYWVDAVCLIDLHRPAREFLPVVLVPLLQRLEFRLEGGHLQHLAALAHSQRDEDEAHNQREGDDGDAEVEERETVQQHETVYHRLDDSGVPYIDEYL